MNNKYFKIRFLLLSIVIVWMVSCKKENIQADTSKGKVKNLSVFRQEYKTDFLDTAIKLIDHWEYNIYGDAIIWDNLHKIEWLGEEVMYNYSYKYEYNSKHKIISKKKYCSGELAGSSRYIYDNTDTLLIKMLDYGWSGDITSDADTIRYEYDSQKRLINEYIILPNGYFIMQYKYFYNELNQLDCMIKHNYNNNANDSTKYEYNYDSYGNIIEEKRTDYSQNIYTTEYEYIYNSNGYIVDYVCRKTSVLYHEQIDYNYDGTIKSKIIYDNSNIKKYFYTYVYEYFN